MGTHGVTTEIVQLGQPLGRNVPHFPGHPAFCYEMNVIHERGAEEPNQLAGSSGALDHISTGLHVGTHIDSLSHIAMDGLLFDGTRVFEPGVQDREAGVQMRSGGGFRPIVAPGVLLDFTSYLGCDVLEESHQITVEELLGCANSLGVELEAGMVVLIRTGLDHVWEQEPERFLAASSFPGPEIEVAKLLRERGVVATGSDTATYEFYPADRTLGVHVELLVKGGIYIMESLRLYELAERGVSTFEFIALPLNMPGATGSPINPVAIIEGQDP